MKKFILLLSLLTSMLVGFSQNKNFWKNVNESSVSRDLFAGRFKPSAYKLFTLNINAFTNDVRTVPSERNVTPAQSAFIISIPNDKGTIERFRVVEAPVMDPALAARYPDIRSYAGQGIDEPSSNIRFDVSPRGFHAMITSAARPTIYIDPLNYADHYVVFSRKDAMDFQQHFSCGTDVQVPANIVPEMAGRLGADDGKLRTYRLALACTGEYAQYFLNGTETTDAQRKTKVLAAMNTLLTRTDQIYERDFGVRMVLIANNDAIIYLDPATDPWTTEWNTKTQQTIDAVIGNANYDIGHLVHKEATAANNNGNAGCIACVCKTGSKGSGFTSHVNPEGDPFVVDYTTHEMGHQFGGNHTFTHSNEGTTVQVEPGSGSTIMGYAGITGATTDVQPHSDDYFHSKTIEQVSAYIKGVTGGGCAVVTTTGNTAPVVNAGADYTIPKSTPFAITGTASDVNSSNVLQYCWEQIDNRGTGSSVVPSATATAGPAFRSYNYSTALTRTVPQLQYILTGANGYKWEVLPSVARNLNFRFTARDNNAGGGNNNTDDIVVTVSTAGPFAVTAPNTAVTWGAGTSQTVTWSVNSTNIAPVNCANVKISLSTDGGLTFPTVIVASTPNDGTQPITVPAVNTTTARIKIEAVGNIFFDICNTNFTINGTPPACGTATGLAASAITNTSATISWSAVTSALNYDVDYKAAASGTWINAATATTSVSVNLSGLTQGTLYDWRVRANCSAGSGAYAAAQFTTTSPVTCGTVTGLASSSITSSGATVSWSALSGANNYDVDYKAASSGTWINAVAGTTATSRAITGLTSSTLYDWRVRANCTGATGAYSAAQFTTAAPTSNCVTAYEANETQATAAAIATNTAISAAIGSATDIDYYKVTTTVTSNFSVTLTNLPGDYDITMYNAAGTQIGSSAASGTSNETITLANQAAGTYYLKVIGYSGAFSTTVCYNLNVGATAASGGCQSTYDNATNGTTGGAATIPFNTNVTGLISPSGDIDNYKFVITTGGTITITLATLPADYDLKLLNSAGTQVGISQMGGTTSESISYTAAAGTYYVQVYGYSGANSATVCYTLKVQLGTASKEGVVIPVSKAVLKVYPNPASSLLKVSLLGDVKTMNTLQVIDARGIVVMEKRIRGDIETLDISGLAKGSYTIRVNGENMISSKFIKQ
jgi:transposase-like protein